MGSTRTVRILETFTPWVQKRLTDVMLLTKKKTFQHMGSIRNTHLIV